MKYSYVALNTEYKKVSGMITAIDRDAAKEELHKMGLSVLKMAEDMSPDFEVSDEDIQNFWFLARDQKGKDVTGTIEATDRKSALKRLLSEYNFQVLSLCSTNVDKTMRLEQGKERIEELEKEVTAELGMDPIHRNPAEALAAEEKNAADGATAAQKHFQQQKGQILEEVNSVTDKAEEILEKYKEQISPEEYRSIQRNLDTLMRIKLSNNIPYIQSLSEELYESIHNVLNRYEQPDIGSIGISDGLEQMRGNSADMTGEHVHNQAVQNTSALGQIRSISKRLGSLESNMRHKGVFEKTAHVGGLIKNIATTKSNARRQQYWQQLKSFFQSNPHGKKTEQTKEAEIYIPELHFNVWTSIIEEVRLFTGWLLGFYILFFFFAEYAFLKGFDPVLPLLKSLFDTPFLIFFAAFLFFTCLNLSLWHHFLRKKPFSFLLSSAVSLFVFVAFLVNF